MAVSTTTTPSKPDDTPNNSSIAKPKNDDPGSVLEEFDNRKTCHQCRQRTLNSVAHCKNQRLDSKYSKHRSYQKPCPNKYCTKCLLNRYGEKVEEVEMLADWKCPKCRDICNCSNCRKSKGHEPTGCLAQTAKKTGFSSVSDMLIAKGPENFRYTRVVKDEQMLKTPKKCSKENSVVVNGEVSVQKHPLTSEGDVKKDGEEKQDEGLVIDLNCGASALEGIELKPMKKEKKVKRKEDGVILEKKRRKKSHLSKDSTPGESNKDESATAKNDGLLEKMDSKNLKLTLETNETNGLANHGNGDGGLKLEMKGDTSSCVLENIDLKPPKKAKRTKKSDDGAVLEKKRRKKSQILEDTAQKSTVQEDGSLKLEMKGDTSSSVLENIDSKPPKKGKKTKKSDDGAVLEKKRRKKKDTAQKSVLQEDMLKDTKGSVMKDSKDSLLLPDLNEAPVDEIVCNGQAKPKSRPLVDKVKKDAEEVRREVPEIPIQLPQGIDLKAIVGVDLLDEDVGPAIQFLEFCKAFGEVFDLKIGQPETLLRDLTSGTSRLRTRQYSPIIRFQIKLLSLIQENLGERSLSPSSKGSSIFQALQKCISNSHCKLEELPPNCFDKGGVVYEQLDSSTKLKILNYLCDETLSTDELRAWIEKQNLKLEEREREARQKVLAAKNKEKDMKQQILVEMAKQTCTTETDNSLSTIRADTEKAHAEVLEAISMVVNKKQRSDAVRTDPVVSDGNGHIFWRLPGYSPDSDILLQDIGSGDPLTPQEKWFTYDVEQKQVVEKCVSSLRKRCKVQALKRKELLKPASLVTLT
ncbi:hypothetical protein C5167_005617 [Papaver somniferum]|uniref:DDT domain-containing protein n=1 Tax=Papaver somniferum TaxID=3469 RepID=A0A4Y7JE87_PAPSO|nr:uncharacterized protein LOC113275627 [Papaver somniferum]RZC58310.1 hypothetical protein C5167_005617 [Papaver somniferum]